MAIGWISSYGAMLRSTENARQTGNAQQQKRDQEQVRSTLETQNKIQWRVGWALSPEAAKAKTNQTEETRANQRVQETNNAEKMRMERQRVEQNRAQNSSIGSSVDTFA